MTVTQKPLLLKDFLELDPNSDSNDSFISFPRKQNSITVRFLIQAEQCRGAKLLRSRSKNALSKLSNMFNSVTYSSSKSNIARKLSRKLWSRSKKDEGKVTVKDIVRLNSFELYGDRDSLFMTSPAVSSCSSCSGECSDSLGSTSSGGSECFGGAGVCDLDMKKLPAPNDLGCSLKNNEANSLSSEHARSQSEEEKEQFSPVSVMDFPDNIEDNNEENDDEYSNTSPYFARIERTTHQLLQKIRRFEALAELEPLDLQFHFTPSDVASDEEHDGIHVAASNRSVAFDLIQRLKADRRINPQLERIIVDFFLETMSVSLDATSMEIERSVTIAEDWIDGGGCLKREDHGKAQLCDMERNGRWRSFEDGRDDVAADLEFGMLENLLLELVIDISDGFVC